MKKVTPRLRFIVTAVFVFIIAAAAPRLLAKNGELAEGVYNTTAHVLNTYMDQHIYADKDCENIAQRAVGAAQDIENLLSWNTENSDVWKINSEADSKIEVSRTTVKVLKTLCHVAEVSGGAYDPTTLPLVKTWGFDSPVQYVPENSTVIKALRRVGYKNLVLDTEKNRVTVKKHQAIVYLDNVIKGAACDAVVEMYKQQEINGALVAIGECMAAYGTKGSTGFPWNVELRDPMGEDTDVLGILSFSEGFVATKGIYQDFFVEGDTAYSNIVNPKKGYPVKGEILSVTVLSDSGVLSEAAAYACVVAGKDKIRDIAEQLGIKVLVVTSDKKIFLTSGLTESFTLRAEGYIISFL